jgi:hypothetical protein
MNKFFIALFFISLNSCQHETSRKDSCSFFATDLFKIYGRAKFQITKSRTEGWTDATENLPKLKKGGLFQFDRNQMLRFYAFLVNDSNEYSFSLAYDSLGNIVNRTGGDVVNWVIDKHDADSLDITFLLYSIHFSYGRSKLVIDRDTFANIRLFKSANFSNLIGGSITIPHTKYRGRKIIYLSGLKKNMCTSETSILKDSISFDFP